MAKLIVDNELDDLWRRENPETSEFTRYDRSSGTRYRVDRIYTDIKAASNTRINHIVVSFTDHYNAIFIDRFSSQTKIKKIHGILIIFLYVSLSSPQLQILFFSNTKTTTLQQVTGGKTLNLVLKMLEPFLKIQENTKN